MKKLGILLGVLCITLAHSQTFNYYKVGQDFEMNDKACLVIKNDYRTLLHILALEKYQKVKAVKLVGFNSSKLDIDSLFELMSDLTQVKCLMFEDCDLFSLTGAPEFMTNLQEVRVLKNCAFDENLLYYCLKDCPLKTLYLPNNETNLVTDSLHLLKSLAQLNISDNNTYTKANKVNSYRVSYKHVPHDINVAYYGTLYKDEPKKITVRKPKEENKVQPKFRNEQLSCIKQPLPGININDTAYAFSSKDNVSLRYKSGTTITIDKNSFVNKDGSPYNGPVNLSYREFRNPVEIMLSGIPMTTKSENGDAVFRSGGMYEVYAYDNKGNALNTATDNSLKINFALTDTATDFKFYTLQDNGSWTTKDNNVTIVPSSAGQKNYKPTKATKEYLTLLSKYTWSMADTTSFERRFTDFNYLYTYRKNQLRNNKDSTPSIDIHTGFFTTKEKGYSRGLFRIKYKKTTKDGEVVFTIVPVRKNAEYLAPAYIRQLYNKIFVYTGDMTKDEFRNSYCRKMYYWDLRQNAMGNSLNLKLKTAKTFINLTAKEIILNDDNTYMVTKKGNLLLNHHLAAALKSNARKFNGHGRYEPGDYNNLITGRRAVNSAQEAFAACNKLMTTEEKKMNFSEWVVYVNKVSPYRDMYSTQSENLVGNALLQSGLGIQNIDCYIHSGEMQEIFVNYKTTDANLAGNYCAMLYKTINTSYPLTATKFHDNKLRGYYFKNKPNYIIRFSDNGYMQVTKPEEAAETKTGSGINLAYTNQYLVKNLNSTEITRLILE